jgi:hypothetical protein
MNLPTLILAGGLVLLVSLAVRYTRRHGVCEVCGEACGGHCALRGIDFQKIRRELAEERKKEAECFETR